jgi:hypothetical protein
MINTTDCKFKIPSWFKTRLWLGFAISLLCSAASARNYPVSGVWVAAADRFPGSTAAACFMLKKVGINAVATQRFPRLMIFSEDRRFEVRRDYRIEKTPDLSKIQRMAVFESQRQLASAGSLGMGDGFSN